MPGAWFDELAAGGGSAEAVDFLVRAERTRRLMLLGELLDRLDEQPGALAPLGPAEAAWRLIAEAAEARPEAAEELLMSPQVGCWTAHMLRRLHGTADGPPLWADAGHLFAIALVARIRAGLDADLPVPLRDGGLALPTLGLARIGGLQGFGSARARLRGPDLRLTAGGRTVLVRPRDAAWRSHWTPARTFPGTSIWLDDLDPYRDLDEPVAPEPLPGAEAELWHRLFGEATAVLAGGPASAPGRLRIMEVRRIVPGPTAPSGPVPGDPAEVSATTSDAFGSMLVSRPADGVGLAEAMVHEFQHSKLGALLHLFPLVDDDGAEVHYAPWRADPRHTTGLLHGAYAFTGVTGFWRDRMADLTDGAGGQDGTNGTIPSGAMDAMDRTGAADGTHETGGAAAETAAFHFALRRLQTRLVIRTLLTRARLTGPGTRLLHGLAGTLDGWLREDVAPSVAARARAAALSHHVEWRLRNLRCGDQERTLLVSAYRAGAAPPPAAGHDAVPA
ncbi:HEXXH motif domain-containing protein, partial [Streptomyces bambusae]|nr:HEXXH motif domain-containing protein [Streptomyces bambusae]